MPPLSAAIPRDCPCGCRERSYLAYVPAKLPLAPALIIVLHGSGIGRYEDAGIHGLRVRSPRADQCGFAVLYPDGYQGNWNDCPRMRAFAAKKENIDDMNFIRALIDHFKVEHAIDAKRVYAFGYSNGAHMAFRLAMEAPDASSCPQQGSTSRVMLMNGTEDPINPYQGGLVTIFGFASRGTVLSSEASARIFANAMGSQPHQSGRGCRVGGQTTRHRSRASLGWLMASRFPASTRSKAAAM